MIALTDAQIEMAARFCCRAEGWAPDKITGMDRPMWHVYAELLRRQFLPAINHALAGVSPEGLELCPDREPLPPP